MAIRTALSITLNERQIVRLDAMIDELNHGRKPDQPVNVYSSSSMHIFESREQVLVAALVALDLIIRSNVDHDVDHVSVFEAHS